MSRGSKIIVVIGGLCLLVVFACLTLAAAAASLSTMMANGKVAVVRVEGPIVSASAVGWSFSSAAADERVIADLERADSDRSIAAIVLHINSPGGSVVASDGIYRAIKQVSKPVIAYLGETAASGGYYIACGADVIISHPATITGSIGVISDVINAKQLFDKLGIEIQVIKSAEAKDMGSPTKPLTEEERAILQALVDEAYQDFVDVVATARGLPREEVLRVADGRVFSGRKAVELGLVDQVGTMDDAVRVAAERAGIKGEPQVVEISAGPSLWQVLMSSASDISALLQTGGIAGPRLEYRLAP